MDYLTLGYLLIGIAVVLMIAELFIPSGGLISVVAVITTLIGVVLVFRYGEETTALITLVAVLVGLPMLSLLLMKIWPYTPVGRRLVLRYEDSEDSTFASMPEHKLLQDLVGRIGKATSSLRPSGTVDFDGRRVDAVTEGMMVEPGRYVKCIEVKAGRVLVRLIDNPEPGTDFENANFQDFN